MKNYLILISFLENQRDSQYNSFIVNNSNRNAYLNVLDVNGFECYLQKADKEYEKDFYLRKKLRAEYCSHLSRELHKRL